MIGMNKTEVEIDRRNILLQYADKAVTSLEEWRKYHNDTKGKTPPPSTMPHYAISPDGYLIYTICEAFDKNEIEQSFLREILTKLIKAIRKCAKTKQISDALKELEQIEIINESIIRPFQLISKEFALLEALPPGKKHRKGISAYAGKKFFNKLEVDKDSNFIKVGSSKFSFRGPDNWAVIDRVLKAIFESMDGYVIDITLQEHNALKSGARDFFKKYCKRKPIPKSQRIGNNKHYPFAKVLIDKILEAT